MKGLFGTTVFESGAEPYYWEDVALFALLTGEWDELEREVRAGLACQAHF